MFGEIGDGLGQGQDLLVAKFIQLPMKQLDFQFRLYGNTQPPRDGRRGGVGVSPICHAGALIFGLGQKVVARREMV